MADEGLSKAEINSIFKRLKSIPSNRQCFDCGANNPTWASVTYGVFVCIDCSAVHRSLGVHITFIRSTQLDTSWTWLQLRAMQVGGNAAANAFFHQHGCSSTDAQQKYNSRAAQMYRERLHSLALKALKQHGQKLHVDSGHGEASSPTIKENVDFFSKEENEYSNDSMLVGSSSVSEPMPINNGRANLVAELALDGIGPNVEKALSMSPTTAVQQLEGVKSTIATRKPAAAKKGGLGAKKGGLGAQKVTTSFTEIESAALQKEKDTAAASAVQPLPAQTGKQNAASLNLAYNELTIEDKKRTEKMKNMDPKKKEQMERLGMGVVGSRGISHSALSDMQSINQETPTNQSRGNMDRYSSRGNRDRDFDDNFDMIRGPPRYDNSFALKSDDTGSRLGRSESNSSWDIIDDKQSGNVEDISVSAKESTDDKGRSRKVHEASDSTDAQKKFGNAKAISSEQYFGGRDTDFEMRQNLSKFEGSSSISSAELFGGGSNNKQSSSHSNYYNTTGSELADIKEGVRQGVTKVAGRLSSLASGVMSSIQNN